jgi:site-specific DNA recombinase
MRVALYTRVSTDDQVRGASLTVQRERLQELADREGWDAEMFSDDGVSSGIAPWDRPGFAAALAWAPAAIAVQDFDRLVRSELHWFQLRQDRPELHIISLDGVDTRRGQDSAMLDGIRALVTADEKRRILQRTTRGRYQRAREGRWVGGRTPFGLRVEDHRLAVHDDELAIVRRGVELVLRHGVCRTGEIASALNAESRLPRQWSPRTKDSRELLWRAETVLNLLRSPHLKGVVKWGPEGLDIPSPALIPDDEWDALQAALSGSRRRSYRAQRTYPLTGRIHSQRGRYVGSMHRGTPQYLIVGVPWGDAAPLRAKDIESRVWDATCATLLDRDKLLALIPSPATDQEESAMREQVGALTKRVSELAAAQARLEVNLAKQGVTEQVAADARRELARERDEAEQHLTRLETWKGRAADANKRRDQILTLTDLDDALRDADAGLQAHVYDVLQLEAHIGAPSEDEIKQHVRAVLGADYVEERFTPGAMSVWAHTLATEALVKEVQGRQADKAVSLGPDLRLTIMGQLAADTAGRFMKTSGRAGRCSGR